MSSAARAWWHLMRTTLRRGRALAAPMAALLAPTAAPAEGGCSAAPMSPRAPRQATACGRALERVESHRGTVVPKDRRLSHDRLPGGDEAWQVPVAVTIGPVDWSRLVPRPEAGAVDRRLAGAGRAQR